MSERAADAADDSAADTDAAESTTGIPPGTYAYAGIVACYTATILLGLSLTDEIAEMGLAMFQDPGSVGNVGVFAVILLVATGGMVAAFRYGYGEALVRVFLLGSASTLTAVAFVALTGVGTIAAGGSAAMGLPDSPASIAVADPNAAGALPLTSTPPRRRGRRRRRQTRRRCARVHARAPTPDGRPSLRGAVRTLPRPVRSRSRRSGGPWT